MVRAVSRLRHFGFSPEGRVKRGALKDTLSQSLKFPHFLHDLG